TDWQLLGGIISVGPRSEKVELHLTMNGRGTLDHDGVIMMRIVRARLGEIEINPAAMPHPLSVWSENPIIKVFPDTPPPAGGVSSGEPIHLYAARGEREALQLVLRATAAMDVTVTVDPPRQAGAHLPAPRVEKVGFVPVLQSSGYHQDPARTAWERRNVTGAERTDGWQGWWPDYLLGVDGPIHLVAQRTLPLWITFEIPRDAEPGVYSGTIRVTGEGHDQEIPFTLRVWRFVLPEVPSLQAIYDLRSGPGWSTAQDPAERERWWRFMSERRISADRILPAPEFRLEDGRVVMDAAEFDEAARLYFDELHMAAAYFPAIFYAAGWGHLPRPFLGQPFGTDGYREAYRQAVSLFWDHVKAKGWADRFVLYLSDEPQYDDPKVVAQLGEIIRLIREVDPEIPVYSSTWGFVPEWEGLLNHWGIAQYGRFPLEVLKRRLEAGDKAWFTTDGQMEINTPYNATERLLPYYAFAHGVDGYEFWGISWYTYDPFAFGWHRFIEQSMVPGQPYWTRYPNGDGYLAYPGELVGRAGPLSTVRLEEAREGLEDYEIYAALRRLADADPILEEAVAPVLAAVEALAVIPNAGGYRSTQILPDPDALLELRWQAGELLDRLLAAAPAAPVSGRVVDQRGRGIGGIAIRFSGGGSGTIVTDKDGYWRYDGAAGYVIASPGRPGWRFLPGRSVAPAGAEDVRFVAIPPPPAVSFETPAGGAPVRGTLRPALRVDLPEPPAHSELGLLSVRFDGELLYQGKALPGDLTIDTRGYPDGSHTLSAEVETDDGAMARAELQLTVDNRWELDDPQQPPLETDWFGTIDFSKTAAASAGWAYATGDPEAFGGDADRRVRAADTDAYLIWEAPQLDRFSVTVYATTPDLERIVRLSVSADGRTWRRLEPEDTRERIAAAGEWYRHRLTGGLTDADTRSVRYFRIDLAPAGLPAEAVQIGHVRLEGWQPDNPAADGPQP
ncbi:MAG TPA: glycoside hydrolase domain-containing protein, partial [Limnochordia bacterium]